MQERVKEVIEGLLVSTEKGLSSFSTGFLFMALVGSALVSIIVLGSNIVDGLDVVAWATGILWIIAFCMLGLAATKTTSMGEYSFVLTVFLLSFIIRIIWVISTEPLALQADPAMFHDFVSIMADTSLQDEALEGLSNRLDYPAWIGRAFPLHYVMRIIFKENDVIAVQIVNSLLSSFTVLLVYGICRIALNRQVARIAMCFSAVLPISVWSVVDYSHHIAGAFYFAASIFLSLWIYRHRSSFYKALCGSIPLSLLLCILSIQRGVHLLMIGLLMLLVILSAFQRERARNKIQLAIFVLLIPLFIMVPFSRQFNSWARAHDKYKLAPGLTGFLARGWNLETMGEYYGPYEQIARTLPQGEKQEVMLQLVLTQIHRYPVESLIVLPGIKILKFFLVGYASGLEESFSLSGWDGIRSAFRGSRLFVTPFILALAALGCLKIVGKQYSVPLYFLIISATVTCLIFTFLGETSPRYSVYIYHVLLLLAAYSFDSLCYPDTTAGQIIRYRGKINMLLKPVFIGGIGYLLFVSLSYAMVQSLDESFFFRDMRTVEYSGSCSASQKNVSRTLQAFLFRLDSMGSCKALKLPLTVSAEEACTVSMGVRPIKKGNRDDETFLCWQSEGAVLWKKSVNTMSAIEWAEFNVPGGRKDNFLTVELGSPSNNLTQRILLEMGYMRVYKERKNEKK